MAPPRVEGQDMTEPTGIPETPDPVTKSGYELEFDESFDGPNLDRDRWVPYYLPQWSSRAATATRYRIDDGRLRLRIDEGQPPWCSEWDGDTRASALQTGLFAGPLGSSIGQLQFDDGLVVREEQTEERLYTPQYGVIETRFQAIADPRCMVALWMIGFEDEPKRSGEICIAEIFGRNMGPERSVVGMGVHPFGDPALKDDFAAESLAIDATEFHTYMTEWTEDFVSFFVDGELVKTVWQSPSYPMQLMLSVYEFPEDEFGDGVDRPYPKEFVVDYVRGWRRA
jgi:Glycosyl hydrolases family 16